MLSFINALVLVALLASFVAAFPAPVPAYQRRGQSFVVTRVQNPNFTKRSGVLSLAKAYSKYGMPMSEGLAEAVAQVQEKNRHAKAGAAAAANATGAAAPAASDVGTVTATPETGDSEFLAPISVGGQTMNMDFDSGSSDLWVFNTQLAAQDTAGHTGKSAIRLLTWNDAKTNLQSTTQQSPRLLLSCKAPHSASPTVMDLAPPATLVPTLSTSVVRL